MKNQFESYQPSPEEAEKAEDMMTEEEKVMSEERQEKKEIKLAKRMKVLKDVLDNIKASLDENGLLEFVKNYHSLSTYTTTEGAKKTRDLMTSFGNTSHEGYSDEKLNEEMRKRSGLDNYQEKEKKFRELMDGDNGLWSKAQQDLEKVGIYEDELLDPLLVPERLSTLISTIEAIFGNTIGSKKYFE